MHDEFGWVKESTHLHVYGGLFTLKGVGPAVHTRGSMHSSMLDLEVWT
jgi:hypothetical protein